MIPYRFAAGLLAALAFGLAPGFSGAGESDQDGDGIPDAEDNCLLVPNGPLLATQGCNDQEDGDQDGYGNPCDTDFNNDGATGMDDVSAVFDALRTISSDPTFDTNCDGAPGGDDLSKALSDVRDGIPLGPSGLACAGSVPCP